MKLMPCGLILASLLLTGCGGGGSGNPTQSVTSQFNPAPFIGTWSGTWSESGSNGEVVEQGNITMAITAGEPPAGNPIATVTGTIDMLGGSLVKTGSMTASPVPYSSNQITLTGGTPPPQEMIFSLPSELQLQSTSGSIYPINWSPIVLERTNANLVSVTGAISDSVTGDKVNINLTSQ